MPRDPDQTVSIPGDPTPVTPPDTVTVVDPTVDPTVATAGDDSALADLQAQLAALKAENEALQAKVATAPVVTDSTVFQPVTRHGAQALSSSEFASMTTAEVKAGVAAGTISLGGRPSVLCADGYFCSPSYR